VAARGERGVDHVLRIIQAEMMVTLGLTGVNDVRELDRTVVLEE
jgi:isopentenyl diphosphate isomerase/L-lactate dehydrogenase-like FMN-dependent dehydrogenase